jgi:NADP-dependent 3-hydroxy acid dehydrogenase YdfG
MAKAPRSLAGQVVAITGGGRGIGRATAAALIVQGARVAIGDIDAPLAERTAQELGGGTIGLSLDVTERTSFEAFLRAVETRLGPLDVLINNAGIMPVGPFVEETDATARRLIDINLNGVIIGSKLALSRFLPRGRGHLVNIASTAGKAGFPGGATYCATKHAVVGLSEAIRAEVRGTEIGVSIVMPVGVNTELYSGLKSARGIKTAEPEDVANAIVEALQTGRVDVFVPRSVGRLLRLTSLVGRRVSDAVTRALKADQVLTNPNHAARAAYEQRLGDTAPPTGKSTTEQGSPVSAGDDAIAAPGEAAPSEREKQVV